jgi:GTP-binding protein
VCAINQSGDIGYNVISAELESFGAGLEKKPVVVIASKTDVANPDKLAALRKHARKLRLALYEISAVTGKGIPELKYALGNRVREIRAGTLGAHASRKPPARRKAVSLRKTGKPKGAQRIPKRAAFKKRKSR